MMPNKNYVSGCNFERRVKKHLEKLGYYVIRSAGSKGQIDIVAVSTDFMHMRMDTLLIQCKHGVKISEKERDDLLILDRDIAIGNRCIVAWAKKGGKINFFTWVSIDDKYEWREATWIK